ncbi:hypothetical protein SAMN05444365_109147 [Micromonospora pattaloongensis]|uniref:DUF3558 domain-containing protein n=1 Tax=Micromonospora pattaloongensis TaxID=405436 RepID=A0A1H3RZ80_9ACTN|nr:hypothetical protein [Micromonospora pattaloongensis]SDZ30179.1 hypothetical protein SAMN05444365_109147 [Micromonospora pattaloongensis]
MRRLILPAVCLAMLALAGCGGDSTDPGTGPDGGVDLGPLAGDGSATPPPCPFTAAKAAELVGQQLVDQGNCHFGDGKGVASLTVNIATRFAGEMTYDYQRKQAEQTYAKVTDLDGGRKGYLAVKDIAAEAVLIADHGSYTFTLDRFQRLGSSPNGYEDAMARLLDALPQ